MRKKDKKIKKRIKENFEKYEIKTLKNLRFLVPQNSKGIFRDFNSPFSEKTQRINSLIHSKSKTQKLKISDPSAYKKLKFLKSSEITKSKFSERKPLLIFLIILSLLLVNSISIIHAQDISAEGVTTIIGDLDPESIFDSIKKIYEINPSSLEKGYSATLNEKDAFKLNRIEKSYYIIVWNITDDNVIVIFPGNRILNFSTNDVILVDMNQDNKLDIILELKSIEPYENSKTVVSIEIKDGKEVITRSIEKIQNKKANFYIKIFIEKELIPEGDYFELFDITVRLAEETIYSMEELEAFITFENFGEGPSEIDIVYSIINKNGKEIYRGVDSKVVQTEDLVVKDFNFLELPLGKYILRTEIFYGKNQTGDSEQDFEIIEESFFSIYRDILIFILTIIILFLMIAYLKKHYEINHIAKEIYDVKKGDKYKNKKRR